MRLRQLPFVFLSQGFEEKGSAISNVGAHVHEAIVLGIAELEVGGEELVVAFCREDGDGMCW
jgi:hypothetical protein